MLLDFVLLADAVLFFGRRIRFMTDWVEDWAGVLALQAGHAYRLVINDGGGIYAFYVFVGRGT